MPMHVRKGDQVMITAGKHRGETGEVSRVMPSDDKVIVKGKNLKTKHVKPTQANPQGGIIQIEAPLHISNVSPVVDGKPTRVRFETKSDGSKVRVAVRDGSELGEIRSADAKKSKAGS
ncbi:MAG: 50S ribosomal protein L24 [Planctomycetota bacterium]